MGFVPRTPGAGPSPDRAAGFPAGLHVRAHSGQYEGKTGTVVDRTPDLRPGSVWVEFARGHARLVPGYRLDTDETQLTQD